jgi:hypothetical protein
VFTLQARVTSAITGPLNPAYIDFGFAAAGTFTEAELVARVVSYVGYALYQTGTSDTVLEGVRWIDRPGPGFHETDYPAAEVDAIHSTFVGVGTSTDGLPFSFTDWGFGIGAGAALGPSGRGDSVCVNTKSTTGGRSGQGKHFLPYTGKQTVDSSGLIGSSYRAGVAGAYNALFLGVDWPASTVGIDPVDVAVISKKGAGAAYPISSCVVSQIPSRLRSRTK